MCAQRRPETDPPNITSRSAAGPFLTCGALPLPCLLMSRLSLTLSHPLLACAARNITVPNTVPFGHRASARLFKHAGFVA